jgi:hypothetical protein
VIVKAHLRELKNWKDVFWLAHQGRAAMIAAQLPLEIIPKQNYLQKSVVH